MNLNPNNPYLRSLRDDLAEARRVSKLFPTIGITKNDGFVQYFKSTPVKRYSWNLIESKLVVSNSEMDIPVNHFTEMFKGIIFHVEDLWKYSNDIRDAFLNSIIYRIKREGLFFHITEKTSETMLYVGTREMFEEVLGELPSSGKFKKTLAAIASAVDRFKPIGIKSSIRLVVIDSAAKGFDSHVNDGCMGLFYNAEYIEDNKRHPISAAQMRIHRRASGGIIKACCSFGTVAALVYQDVKRYMDPSLPTDVDGYVFTENIKGGFHGLSHGNILTVDTREELSIIKKAKKPGENTAFLGGQLQFAAMCQSRKFKNNLLSKTNVRRKISLMKDIWENGSLESLFELGFNKSHDDTTEKILSRLMFENLRDNRTTEIHKNIIFRAFADNVRKIEHHDKSWMAYAVGLIGIGLAEKWEHDNSANNHVIHYAITPCGCDIESLAVRYPATSSHSVVSIVPVFQLEGHDVVIIANSVNGWHSWLQANFGDFDGDTISIYRDVTDYVNIKPNFRPIPSENIPEPEEYIDGIINSTLAAIKAKSSISESDRAVRKGFLLMFVAMYENSYKVSVERLAKFVEFTASIREQFIKSQKRTEVSGKETSIERRVLSLFPEADFTDRGRRAAELLFNLTTSDGGIGLKDKETGFKTRESDRINQIVSVAKEFMSPEYERYHDILNSFPFIKEIARFSTFRDQDYQTLDENTLKLMYTRGCTLKNRYNNADVRFDYIVRCVLRCGQLIKAFNNAMRNKDIGLIKKNPLFCHLTSIPHQDARWRIQRDGVRTFWNKTITDEWSSNEIMVAISLMMTGWDGSPSNKFEGFGVRVITREDSSNKFIGRGHIFWMLPKRMLADAAFVLASKDADGNIINPFIRDCRSPEDIHNLLESYSTEDMYEAHDQEEPYPLDFI